MLVNVSHSFMSDSATPWTVGGCSPPLSSAQGIFQEYCNFLLPGIFLILELRSPTSGPLGKPKYVLSLFFNFLVKKCFIEVFIAVVQFTQGECLEIHRLFTALMLADTVTCVWWTRTSLGWRSELTEPWVTPWSCHWMIHFSSLSFSATDKNECLNSTACPLTATCKNTQGSYFCVCNPGFETPEGRTQFIGSRGTCVGKQILWHLQGKTF